LNSSATMQNVVIPNLTGLKELSFEYTSETFNVDMNNIKLLLNVDVN